MNANTKRVTFDIDLNLYKELKMLSLTDNKSMKQILNNLIKKEVKGEK